MIRFIIQDKSSHSRHVVNRREWLRIGGLTGLGLAGLVASPGPIARASALPQTFPGRGRAKSVILIYANGGQSQFETWDPKPDAPAEIRGAFGAIGTAVPGTFLSEHLPMLAAMANRYALVRSVSHDDVDHGSATYLALTGRYHPRKSSNPPPGPDDFPTLGAVLTRPDRVHGHRTLRSTLMDQP